jgi:hypothetical protein
MNNIEQVLYLVNLPDGERIQSRDKLSEFQKIDIYRSKIAKRAKDANLKKKSYYQALNTTSQFLDHYENDVNWYNRDDSFDFEAYKYK